MKLAPDAKVHPESVVFDPTREIIEVGGAYVDTGGITVREHAYLLAWQAKLIADAIRREGTVEVAAEVRELFGEPAPLAHEWRTVERVDTVDFARGREVLCGACGHSMGRVVSAPDVYNNLSAAKALNASIDRGEAEPCPGKRP